MKHQQDQGQTEALEIVEWSAPIVRQLGAAGDSEGGFIPGRSETISWFPSSAPG